MHPPARCCHSITPSPPSDTVSSSITEDLEHFPWSELNTLPHKIQHTRRKPILHIQVRCRRQLSALAATEHKTEGLKLLLAGIKALMQQSWRLLLVYFDEGSGCANQERPWSHMEWRRWDVVAVFVRVALAYHRECEKASKEAVLLVTDRVDRELLSLVNDVLSLGADAAAEGGVITIREWERVGTISTLRSRGVLSEDWM